MRIEKDFIHKEISWLSFNERVLQEAGDKTVPLISRIKFLGIYSSNLDEYFRVRVATLKRLASMGKTAVKIIGENPKLVLQEVEKIVFEQSKEFEAIYTSLLSDLESKNVYQKNEKALTDKEKEYALDFFRKSVRPKIFPMMLTSASPIPDLQDASIYLAVRLSRKSNPNQKKYSIIEVPTAQLSRFLILPNEGRKKSFMMLDDVIRLGLGEIFSMFSYDSFKAYTIKLTRDAELDIDDDFYGSYIEKLEKSIKRRKEGSPVRFVYDKKMPDNMRDFLMKKLKINKNATLIPGGRYHNFKDFIGFPDLIGGTDKEKVSPIMHEELFSSPSVLSVIRKKDIMLHTPYHSFTHFIDMLREASIDPAVQSISVTLYRVAKNSSVANALINAVKNGKNVTALIELQARFDEESNIFWANKLKEEGAKVLFGVPGLKVHSKLCLIDRKEGSSIRRYACVGTGNFNEDSAKIYTDKYLLTSDERITGEVSHVFDFFISNYKRLKCSHLIVSPYTLRTTLNSLIDREIENAKAGEKAEIVIKINNIADRQITQKIYEARDAGVKIRMLVRGMFSIVTDSGGENRIEAIGIVDKYLEHSRVLYFYNGGDEKYFISSADWLPRNLDKRIEITCPIYDKKIQKQIKDILELQWKDNTKARILNADLDNSYVERKGRRNRAQNDVYCYLKKCEQ